MKRTRARGGLDGYHDIRSYPDAWHLPGLVIYRFDARCSSPTPRPSATRSGGSPGRPATHLDRDRAEPVTDVDTTASDVLEELDETLNAQHISLVFAELKDPCGANRTLRLTRTIDPRHFFPTIESAVEAFRQETGPAGPPRASLPPTRLLQPDGRRNRPAARNPLIASPGQGVSGR